MKQLPIFEPSIVSRYDGGLYAVSLVEYPAIEEHFVAMSKQSERYDVHLATVGDSKKRLVAGALLIPEQLIYRNDEFLGEYYLKYSASIIEKLAENFMREGWNLTSTTHEHQVSLCDNVIRELWIVKDPKNDKANALLGKEYPEGTLMCVMKINDPDYYEEQILTGKVKGFSIEAYFRYQLAENQTVNQSKQMNKSKVSAWTAQLKALFEPNKPSGKTTEQSTVEDATAIETPASADATDSAKVVMIFSLADGSELIVDPEGNATINGEQAPAGSHALADGNTIEVDAEGKFVLTSPDAPATSDPATATQSAMTEQERATALQNAQKFLQNRAKPAVQSQDELIKSLQSQIDALKAKPAVRQAVAPQEPAKEEVTAPINKRQAITQAVKARQESQAKGK